MGVSVGLQPTGNKVLAREERCSVGDLAESPPLLGQGDGKLWGERWGGHRWVEDSGWQESESQILPMTPDVLSKVNGWGLWWAPLIFVARQSCVVGPCCALLMFSITAGPYLPDASKIPCPVMTAKNVSRWCQISPEQGCKIFHLGTTELNFWNLCWDWPFTEPEEGVQLGILIGRGKRETNTFMEELYRGDYEEVRPQRYADIVCGTGAGGGSQVAEGCPVQLYRLHTTPLGVTAHIHSPLRFC